MTVNSMARKQLFGDGKTKHPVMRTFAADTGKALATLLDGKPRTGYAWHLALAEAAQRGTAGLTRSLAQWRNGRSKAGVPMNLFKAVDDVLLHRGGLTHEQPNFYCVKAGSFENALMYSIPIGYNKYAKLETLASFELAIEDRLSKIYGSGVNVRVCYKPTRIEVDKASVPAFKLNDWWDLIRTLPTNERVAVPGVAIGQGGVELAKLELTNDRFASFIVANSGYGKTQLGMALILSLAMLNSPDELSMFICDVKADDWIPFGKLPHLAQGVITEAVGVLATVKALVAEMDARKAQSMNGDRTFKRKTIMLYIDELSDVFASLEADQCKELATALQRLSQRGRSAGFIVIAATQRLHDLKGYAEAYSKLRLRIAGNTTSNNDAASIVGPGVSLNKLPVGAFEIHSNGTAQRIQAFLVAEADHDDYPKRTGRFIADIAERWHGVRSHYQVGGDGGTVVDSERTIDDFVAYLMDNEIRGIHKIRTAHKEYFGTGIGAERAKELREMLGE